MTVEFSKTLLEKITPSYIDNQSIAYDEKEYVLR
jgi:hypothetical protein